MDYHCQIESHGTPAYEKMVVLRDQILRKPLGLAFTKDELAAEHSQWHIACYSATDKVLIGCCILVPFGTSLKMRQVAVAEAYQRKGVGKALALFCEKFALENGNFQLIYCSARVTAVPFYEKLGYKVEGKMFKEVGIDHFKMFKKLS